MEKWVSIGKLSKILGVSISALRMWEKRGILVPNRTPTGHRRYALSQIESFEVKKYQRTTPKSAYIYARVSTPKQADAGNLDRQIGRLTEYAIKKDLVAITTSFSARIYGKRGGRVAKKLADTIKQEVSTDENDS